MESWRDWQENNPYYSNNDWKPERSIDDDDDDNDRNGNRGKGRGKSRKSTDDDETAGRGIQGQKVKLDK